MSRKNETTFPWTLAEEVFEIILKRGISVARYCDIKTDGYLARSAVRYIGEYVNYAYGRVNTVNLLRGTLRLIIYRYGLHRHSAFAALVRQGRPPTLILQHDADRWPELTIRMMELEMQFGLRSSNFFFVHHANEGEIYELHLDRLRELEAMGFEIGYHQNAYERAGYNYKKALELVEKDVEWLGRHFKLRSFVPHGGRPGISGRNNLDLGHAGALKSLFWAYNGRCMLKDFTWSDGGISFRNPGDPRAFVRSLPNGARAMMLMHPQYYGTELRPDWKNLPLAKAQWWRQLWQVE